MSPNVLNIVGIVLMSACGSALGRRMGLAGAEAALFAGFAVGILLMSFAFTASLRKRVAVLEAHVASIARPPAS